MPKVRVDNSSFCFTGGLREYRRRQAEEMVRLAGGRVSHHVTSSTDYLVAGNGTSSSGNAKMRDAKRLGVKVISEAEFISAIA